MFVPLLVTSLDGFLSAPQDIAVHAPEYREEVKTVADLYPPKTEVFLLHPTYYGCQAEVRACVCLYMCTLMCACVFGILGASCTLVNIVVVTTCSVVLACNITAYFCSD